MDSKNWDRIAHDYYSHIISPLKHGRSSLLLSDISRFANKGFVVADVGCGIGELTSLLSEKFGSVYNIDFSSSMIAQAKLKNGSCSNVNFFVRDMSLLSDFYGSFDILISVNSVLSHDLVKVDKIFSEFYHCLKDGGVLLCVLPAMEVFAYESLLMAQEEFGRDNHDLVKVRGKVRKFIKKREHDFLFGITNFQGLQKAYYRFEILWRLSKAGFRDIRVNKLFYPWKEFADAGQRAFPDEDLLPWDWYVTAKK